jgi:hypothetical protein
MTKKAKDVRSAADYEVGYKQTPAKSRWPKGVSGNPSGKSKKELEEARQQVVLPETTPLPHCLIHELATKIVVNDNGKPLEITASQAIAKVMVRHMLTGNAKEVKGLVELLIKFDIFFLQQRGIMTSKSSEPTISPEESRMLEFIRQQLEDDDDDCLADDDQPPSSEDGRAGYFEDGGDIE